MKTWKVLHSEPVKKLDEQKIIKILLKNRGLETKKEIEGFLNPSLDSVTFQAVGVDDRELNQTLDLIQKTIKENKWIVIYGDYDVDGICAAAILWETIYAFYRQVQPYIPHRIDEGYGLSEKGIQNLESKIQNIGLIITVDNGVVAHKAIEYAKSLGISVIVTDHHVAGDKKLNADAVVHTTQLCGTGIAYLLAKEITNNQAPMFKPINNEQFNNEEEHLELVALATVADLVPLNKYNRALLKSGLEYLRTTKRLGLLALFDEAQVKKEEIDTYHIGHIIAPRLNASGRITHALDSLRLLCTKDAARAKVLAKHLGNINRERQQITFDSAEEAKNQIRNTKLETQNILVVESEMYEQGVIGLIASRLVEEFYKPAIAVSVGEKISKGSARSVSGVNIIELIRSCSDILSEAGGHPMAAGFSIETIRLEEFKNKLISLAEKLDKNLFQRNLTIDMELPWNMVGIELCDEIEKLKPFGMGNPQPVFFVSNVTVSSFKKVGVDGKHLQLFLEKDGKMLKGIFFRHNGDAIQQGSRVDVVFTPDKHEWNGNISVELKIKDIKIIS
ncbi:MAG: single-stranded-DNA-specific exonuclease RecJ [Candidatus Levyibacteriota bacterium]